MIHPLITFIYRELFLFLEPWSHTDTQIRHDSQLVQSSPKSSVILQWLPNFWSKKISLKKKKAIINNKNHLEKTKAIKAVMNHK